MSSLKYSDILARNRELGKTIHGQPYRIAVLSNIIVNQLGEMLEYVLRNSGCNAQVVFGDYDNILQGSTTYSDYDAVLVFWEAANLTDGFHASAESTSENDLSQLVNKVEREIELTLQNLKNVPLILFNTFSSLIFTSDDLRAGAFKKLCYQLNDSLALNDSKNLILIDLDTVLARVGLTTAVDFRQFQSTKALYTIEFLKSYSNFVAPAFYATLGKAKKVLVLDCDNTLWGGIVGEDGATKIEMNDLSRAGQIFSEIQKIILGYQKQGVILALCSKNNPEDVDQILSEHSDILLQEQHIVAKKVNWNDKVQNLRELATELNLGLDSFVFVDDSSFEIGLVTEALPEVTCVRVPERLSDYPSVMRSLSAYFYGFSHTQEDSNKTKAYKQEQERQQKKRQFANLPEYLSSLQLMALISWNEYVPLARAAQLTQKTNQFNLRTRRYSEAEMARMIGCDDHSIISFAVNDRYGDYGVTGLFVIVIEKQTAVARVDTFLMSCRIIGRNIEIAVFDYLICKLQEKGISRIMAEYVQTPKNNQVSCFYDSLGFTLSQEEAGVKIYDLELSDYRKSKIDYIEVRENDS